MNGNHIIYAIAITTLVYIGWHEAHERCARWRAARRRKEK